MTMTKTHGLNVLMASRLYVVYLLALPLSSFTNGGERKLFHITKYISHSTYDSMLTEILYSVTLLWDCSMNVNRPEVMVDHCTANAAISRLNPTLPYPYRRRKVIRNPNPIKIITCTSWKTTEAGMKNNWVQMTIRAVHKIFNLQQEI